ncbi:MAG: alternative ribosome rescue aminoacyl-tRNA hydrolase ArfB [Bdellovibrionales bacterium]
MSLVISYGSLKISEKDLEYRFSRSSGPGGQKVNKSNTRVEMIWDFQNHPQLADFYRDRITTKLSTYFDSKGRILISSEEHRTQKANRETCVKKLRSLLTEAFHRAKARRKTKASNSTKRKNKDNSIKHSNKKNLRKKVDY